MKKGHFFLLKSCKFVDLVVLKAFIVWVKLVFSALSHNFCCINFQCPHVIFFKISPETCESLHVCAFPRAIPSVLRPAFSLPLKARLTPSTVIPALSFPLTSSF